MFQRLQIQTFGESAEVKDYLLKQHLERLAKSGWGVTTKILYSVCCVPYPNEGAYESKYENGGILTLKRFYLTEGKALILHQLRLYTATQEVLDSRLFFVRAVPDYEFRLMLPQALEVYFA